MIDLFFKLAIPVAGLLEKKEENKYTDELLKIQREIADEEFKPNPDDGRIAYLYGDLVRLSELLINAVKQKNS